jgi:hypothetical protein
VGTVEAELASKGFLFVHVDFSRVRQLDDAVARLRAVLSFAIAELREIDVYASRPVADRRWHYYEKPGNRDLRTSETSGVFLFRGGLRLTRLRRSLSLAALAGEARSLDRGV